jgi:hypothetical protein
VWAWKWDIEEDSEFGNSFGAFIAGTALLASCKTSNGTLTLAGLPLHPLYKSIGSLMDDFVLEHPFLKGCAPFVLAHPHPHLIPSAEYSKSPPPPSLPLYVGSRLRVSPSPLLPATPSEPSPMTPKPAGGTELFASSMNATREAMEATGHAFVTIGASMDVRKWNWPGYLTFSKGGVSQKTALRDQQRQPADAATRNQQNTEEDEEDEEPAEASPDGVAGQSVSPGPEAGLRGEVDTESLHEAMSTDGRELLRVDSTSPTEEGREVADVTPQTASDSVQDEQGAPPPSPSTPIVHPPDLTSPPSLSSSQSTIPVPVPAPSFRSFSLHFSSHDDLLATARRRVLYITVSVHFNATSNLTRILSQKEQLTFAFLEPTPTISDDDNTALYQASSVLLANAQGLIDHDEASHAETPITAAKILQPKDKYLIVKGNDTAVMSAEFASHSEHLFNGSLMIA